MGFFNNFPYTNFHELNTDWIVQVVKKISESYPEDFEKLSAKQDVVQENLSES